jgi:hypothetical protein
VQIGPDTKSFIIKGNGSNGAYHFFTICNLGMPISVACEYHSATSVSMDNTSGSKRTKMILPKQQLPQLLIEKISAAETCRLNSSSRWQTGLETIPEEI